MNNFQLKYLDIGILTLLTLGVFALYIVYAIIYFVKVDKKAKLDLAGKKPGLSRMCLIGIFFLFGLLIFDLTCNFGQIYLSNYLGFKSEHQIINKIMDNSFSFFTIINGYQLLPISLFINGMFIVSFFYIGVEGLISCLKTMNIESGLRIELPEKKKTRLANIFYIWCFLAVLTTVYTVLLGSDTIDFYNKNCVFSAIATLIIVILSERSASAFENVKIVKSGEKTTNMNIIDGVSMKEEVTIKSLINNINAISDKIVDSVVANDANSESDLAQLDNISPNDNVAK